MTSITYVGLDVHTTNYTAACYRFETDNTFAVAELKPKADEIEKYLKKVKRTWERTVNFCAVTKPVVWDTAFIMS